MSSLENIYSKLSSNLEPTAFASLHPEPHADSPRQVGREVAHELNNIFTIIRGYTDRMVIKHGENPALRHDLQLILENIKRAEAVVRQSTHPRSRPTTTVSASSAV